LKLIDQIKSSRHVESDDRLITAQEKLSALKARATKTLDQKSKIGDRRQALKEKSATDILNGGTGDFQSLRKLDDDERALADEIEIFKSVIAQAEQGKLDLKERITREYAEDQWRLAEGAAREFAAALDGLVQKRELIESAASLPHVDTFFFRKVRDTIEVLQKLSDEVAGNVAYCRDWLKQF